MTLKEAAPNTEPNAQEIRAALDRVISSPAFNKSPQLANFLRYVVEATLAGNAERLKAYTIATDALGRDDSFDPQTDPIVRVEAGRLRQALARYNAGEGRRDDVIIDMPRGHYVPVIQRRSALNLTARTARSVRRLAGKTARFDATYGFLRHHRFAAAAIVLAIVAAIGIQYWRSWPERSMSVASAVVDLTTASPQSRYNFGLPIVAVAPIDEIGDPAPLNGTLHRLDDKLRTALARFDEIRVIADSSSIESTTYSTLSESKPDKRVSQYHLTTAVEYLNGNQASLSFHLIENGDPMIVWSRIFGRVNIGENDDSIEIIVREVASSLAQPNGVIQANERRRIDSVDPRYACLLDAATYWRRYSPEAHTRVTRCLQERIASDPAFALGHAYLALVYNRSTIFDTAASPADPSLRLMALKQAQRAVELKPDSARTQAILMQVYAFRGDAESALAAGRRAVALNPYDTLIAAEFGYRLVTFGEVERGYALMRRNATESHVRPIWFNFGLCLAAYLQDEMTIASTYCNAMSAVMSRWPLMLRAVVSAKIGDLETSRHALLRLNDIHPTWRIEMLRDFEKFIAAPAIVDRLVEGLTQLAAKGS